MALTSKSRRKYGQLLFLLEKLDFIKAPEELYKNRFSGNRKRITELLGNVTNRIPVHLRRIKTVYLQQKETKNDKENECIDFDEFASIIENSDRLGNVYAEYLRLW